MSSFFYFRSLQCVVGMVILKVVAAVVGRAPAYRSRLVEVEEVHAWELHWLTSLTMESLEVVEVEDNEVTENFDMASIVGEVAEVAHWTVHVHIQ